MAINQYRKNAEKYLVDDLESASLPSTPLSNTLKTLEANDKAVSQMLLKFLMRKQLSALLAYSRKECSFNDYLKLAKTEQDTRRLTAIKEAQLEAEQQAIIQKKMRLAAEARRKEAEERQRAYDRDPKNIARAKQQALRDKYDLSFFIERDCFPRLMQILRKVDKGTRLSEKEVVWLNLEGKEYFTDELRRAYHCIEARFYATEFKKKKDPWLAVNASSHFRKCHEAHTADQLLNTLKVNHLKNLKLKSAIYTTHGGVKRDLKNSNEALLLGEKAHKLTKKDFRPCTLLGAVNMETGCYDLGQAWYAKAIERGFSEKAMDYELKTIYRRSTKPDKASLRKHLLEIDPHRYRWAK
ncbi:hypothetical protein ACR30L_16185 [Psychromonas sp. PT13]|uniref:hypothetical protein n=1 Tax=Psychromonas sp. PT13 TaxID=3439547 RepID=UPI003EBFF664